MIVLNHAFKILLAQLQIDHTKPYQGARLEKIVIDKTKKSYHFYFTMERILSPQDTVLFYRRLIDRFQGVHGVERVYFTTTLQHVPQNVDLSYYVEIVKDFLALYDRSYLALKEYPIHFNNNHLFVEVKTLADKEMVENRFKKAIEWMYRALGFTITFTAELSDNGIDHAQELELAKAEMERIFQEQLEGQAKKVLQAASSRNGVSNGHNGRGKLILSETQVGYPIRGEVEPISALPLTQEDLLTAKREYVIQGTIFDCQSRMTQKGNYMIEFSITDETDSIDVKVIVREEEHIPYYRAVFKEGNYVRLLGNPHANGQHNEVFLFCNSGEVLEKPKKEKRMDRGYNGEKRIEFHLHTNMSQLDSVTSITDYVNRALEWGHEAIALTDHDGMYALPELFHATKNKPIKPIYGVEVNLVDDDVQITKNEAPIELKDATYVVFDLETTGFSVNHDQIIEIAAVKVRHGAIIEEFSEFCKLDRKLTSKTVELTHITDADLQHARELQAVLKDFKAFCEGAILVAHNAQFDIAHIEQAYKTYGLGECDHPIIDTLNYVRYRYNDQLKRFNLAALARFFKVELTQHHRAIYDARATAEIFLHLLRDMEQLGIHRHDEINTIVDPEEAYKYQIPKHAVLIAKNEQGLKNLFKIVSKSLTDHLHNEPRVVRRFLNAHREGVLVGSACVNGEVWQTALERSYEDLLEVAKYYDYLEVQPPEVYSHLIDTSGDPRMADYILDAIQRIIRAGKELGIPVIATSDAHHLDPEDKMYREIYIDTPQVGGGLHPLNHPDIKDIPSMHFRTTDEMFENFSFLDNEALAYEIIIQNPKRLADQIEWIQAIKDKLYTPTDDFLKDQGIPSIDERVREMCYERAKALYGDPLPGYVRDRLEKELHSIITHGFSVIYYISHMLVKKSNEDGYVVGSRGSVGSSFVATMMGITEVNPLSPHYYCPSCHFSAFKMNEEERKRYGTKEEEKALLPLLDQVESGYDLPDADCPVCQSPLKKDGHDIPFETFLGFAGDKVPDIDLNFSGEYQPIAHRFCQEIFGEDRAFRAGTIGTVAEKTAYGYVKAYFEKRGILKREAEIRRIANRCQGVKRTTGQHPGGIIVVPSYMEIYDITPIQYPADNKENAIRTTHFDFHSIHDNLLKLDILGHDDPTMLRFLQDLTGIKPEDIPLDDPKVYQLFSSTESLGVTPEQILSNTGSYGIPEFGTPFVRAMLEETRPKTFAELVKISGLSHGTDVWNTNAQDLVNGVHEEFGKIPFKDVIGCRDDIMVYLMYNGMEPKLAFDIMEFVRKGRAKKDPEKWQEYADKMRKAGIPEWYIWSCSRIQYMFPKAHATAYVLMAIRIAWFKVNMPIYYYCAYFSKRAPAFDVKVMAAGSHAIRMKIEEIKAKGSEASVTEKDLQTTLEVALEMTERGFYFKQVDLEKSQASEFVITEDKKGLIIPFAAVDGLGLNVANSIVKAREERPFISKEDLLNRTLLTRTLVERLSELGTLDGLNETNQVSLFDTFWHEDDF